MTARARGTGGARPRLRIAIATPAPRGARTGNRVTAERWRELLRALGHKVEVVEPDAADRSPAADLLIAIHARKSIGAIRAFVDRHRQGRVVVALAGTDLSEDLTAGPAGPGGSASEPRALRRADALEALRAADRIVALQPLAIDELPHELQGKARTILQSARPLARPPPRARRRVALVVVGHLRAVKDPLLPAAALRSLPGQSRIRIAHYGAALDPGSEAAARAAMAADARYLWLGERPRAAVRRAIASAHALVHPSRAEGGANTVGEALVLGTPVLASAVAGNIGLLGPDHPGLFPAGDPQALAALLARFEGDPALRADLDRRTRTLAARHRPERERESWERLIDELR